MTIFKKFALQDNFVFTNGQQAVFSSDGFYKTEDESEIAQLSPIYTQVEEADMPKADPKEKLIVPAATGALAVKTGMASSATLSAAVKTN